MARERGNQHFERPRRGSQGPKNRNGRTAFAVTAVPRANRLRSELTPPFFSSPPPSADVPFGRAREGLSTDPQAGWPSHLVRLRQRCESDRVADQPFALRSEALRRSGWNTRLVPPVRAE